MESGVRAYLGLVYRELDCYATWLPGTGIAIGDIGRISKNGTFLRTGSLSARAWVPPTLETAEPSQTISTEHSVTFSADVQVNVGNVVQVMADAGATLDISFSGATAAALVLEDVTRHEFADEQQVRTLMTTMLQGGQLAEDEVVVTYVKQVASGVVATAYAADAGSGVAADVGLGQGTIRVGKVGGHLKIVSQRGSHTVVAAEPGKPLRPVYRALAFHRNRDWWSFWRSELEVQSVIPTLSFGDDDEDSAPYAILSDRPSQALPMAGSDRS